MHPSPQVTFTIAKQSHTHTRTHTNNSRFSINILWSAIYLLFVCESRIVFPMYIAPCEARPMLVFQFSGHV